MEKVFTIPENDKTPKDFVKSMKTYARLVTKLAADLKRHVARKLGLSQIDHQTKIFYLPGVDRRCLFGFGRRPKPKE